MEKQGVTASPKSRIIPFEGIRNFRDMGGYKTTDGRTVKYGVFYRSAELTGMTERDKEIFSTLGIKYIFDYRDDGEASVKPDPVIEGIINERIPAIAGEVQGLVQSMEDIVKSELFKNINITGLAEMYGKMTLNNSSYKRLFEVIQNPENLGIVHHCAAGKDRTGVGAALILSALGVPKETIIEDYLITNETMREFQEIIKAELSGQLTEEELLLFDVMMAAKEEYLQAVFTVIEDTYGNMDIYFEKELNLTAADRVALQNLWLE
ncbi:MULTISPECIES: tyrosine-protein phosphatase [Bacillaceae]|uniref:tyrosine-protein phosphatase n=1 Tax=Bacillaceae TaxID=186817 RepID=UPI001E609D00|nr:MULTISPECIES: tyrosine-protein phosphatase [Bacillaceae]MCE4049881.1 tyrosine-protein phosphatase [Bacillus sp. Au-Bac7]MCM3033224.1 tyrosine-protein phosphatase [Niallia sp. MER 6]MDL0435450.1 tyrosine-protein phosphatase [Niallia sp. SS-2023]UPO87634.1 tyrosine-protein phosphatase [Niallia sp. Man26]